MRGHLTPTEVCERLIGRPEILSGIAGHQEKAAYGWRHGNSQRAPGDIPSGVIMRALLAHSDAHGLGLTADHLIRGAAEAEIEAVLAARVGRTDAAFQSRRVA